MQNNAILIFVFAVFSVKCKNYTDTKPLLNQNALAKTDTVNDIVETKKKAVSDSATDNWKLIEKKAEWFKKGVNPNTDLNAIPNNFITFYRKFISDSNFQVKHIDFENIIAVLDYCDTGIIFNSNNWKFRKWDFMEFFSNDNFTDSPDGWENYYFSTPNKFYYEFRKKEVGLIYQTGFELINGEWMLTLYYIFAC
jgi:hypothetical protein